MKVLLLSPYPERLAPIFHAAGDKILPTADDCGPHFCYTGLDFVVSYGYRHIFRPLPPIPAINLHISLLPWNRGADPNLWSWLEDTPKGVTIHWIDEGIDTGAIITQENVFLGTSLTLASTYALLQDHIVELFRLWWRYIKNQQPEGTKQHPYDGSFHTRADRERVAHLLHSGWDTPVRDLIGRGLGMAP